MAKTMEGKGKGSQKIGELNMSPELLRSLLGK